MIKDRTQKQPNGRVLLGKVLGRGQMAQNYQASPSPTTSLLSSNPEALQLCCSRVAPTWMGLEAFPGGSSGKQSACQCRRHNRLGFVLWVRKIPWSRKWQHTPGFLPQKLQGQRSLVGHRPWGHKESDISEHSTYSRSKIYFSLVRRRA